MHIARFDGSFTELEILSERDFKGFIFKPHFKRLYFIDMGPNHWRPRKEHGTYQFYMPSQIDQVWSGPSLWWVLHTAVNPEDHKYWGWTWASVWLRYETWRTTLTSNMLQPALHQRSMAPRQYKRRHSGYKGYIGYIMTIRLWWDSHLYNDNHYTGITMSIYWDAHMFAEISLQSRGWLDQKLFRIW